MMALPVSSRSVQMAQENIYPVTALAFLHPQSVCVLAGRAQYLYWYHKGRSQLLCKAFDEASIHGIITKSSSHDTVTHILIWGARSVSVLQVTQTFVDDGLDSSECFTILGETVLDNWILAGCFKPDCAQADDLSIIQCAIVTTSNELIVLKNHDGSEESGRRTSINIAANGPISLLYSAHVSWSSHDEILVAAGTVFGLVYLWSTYGNPDGHSESNVRSHCTLTGHQGSVFGVQVSEKFFSRGTPDIRLLASCSDDRTIRVYDISGSTLEVSPSERRRLVSTAMGHSSRIWAVHFLHHDDREPYLVSYGEDASTCIWDIGVNGSGKMTLISTHIYHAGKNIWAAALSVPSNGPVNIVTGGADGSIVRFRPQTSGPAVQQDQSWSHSTMIEAQQPVNSGNTLAKATTSTRTIFDCLEGSWILERRLISSLPTYPSGLFTGQTSFKRRSVTDTAFDAEYVYSEDGDFVTQEGMTMKASRQYVFRYKQDVDQISIWFVKSDGAAVVDYLFHTLRFLDKDLQSFEKTTVGQMDSRLSATGHHLCVKDDYSVEYALSFHGLNLSTWGVTYNVKGPRKDYMSFAKLYRPSPGELPVNVADKVVVTIPKVRRYDERDAFKNYVWISDHEFLVTTQAGRILRATVCRSACAGGTGHLRWKTIGIYEALKSTGMMACARTLGLVFFWGSCGEVIFYSHNVDAVKSIRTPHASKLKPAYAEVQLVSDRWASRVWNHESGGQYISSLVTSVQSDIALASLYEYGSGNVEAVGNKSLVLPSSFIVTSSCFMTDSLLLALGSRNGHLCIYDFSDMTKHMDSMEPVGVFEDIHGKDAVTSVRIILGSHEQGSMHLLTTGRDGRWAMHRINTVSTSDQKHAITLQTVHESILPSGPSIEGSYVDDINQEIVLWGFQGTQFVVWEARSNCQVMAVACGGAHRNWAYDHLDGQGGGIFVWTKASVCNVYTQQKRSHEVLQKGGHGREIKALAMRPSLTVSNTRLLATGAEDTLIRLFLCESEGFTPVCVLTKHTTGLQQLQWSPNGELLFSTGGCEEFVIWRIRSVPYIGIGAVCEAICPPVTEDRDLRIMDFAVEEVIGESGQALQGYLICTVYSDSSLRVFYVHMCQCKYQFDPVFKGTYTQQCLTQVEYIKLAGRLLICSASTDGHVVIWPLEMLLENQSFTFSNGSLLYKPIENATTATCPIDWQERFPVHQSSIKSLLSFYAAGDDVLIATAGDDQTLAVTRLSRLPDFVTLGQQIASLKHSTIILSNSHASAVTSVTPLAPEDGDDRNIYRLASVGNDQRLKMWKLTVDLQQEGVKGCSITQLSDTYSSVADAAALQTYKDVSGESILAVGGIGLEEWRVSKAVTGACEPEP